MPPKRSFTDDYTATGPNLSSGVSSNFIPPKRRKTFTGTTGDWRRPSAPPREWWAVSESEWEHMAPPMKMNWTHVGRIMETEEGEPAPEPCEQCVQAGDPRGCWVYSREAMRRYGFKTHVCARCRATANVCSLNPYFRNSVGLRDNRPPPERPPPHDSPFHHGPLPSAGSDGRHRFASPEPVDHHRRYRSPTPPSERHGRGWPQSPTAKRHSYTSSDERDRYPPSAAAAAGAERRIFTSPGSHHHHDPPVHPQRRLSPTPTLHTPRSHHHPHPSQSDFPPPRPPPPPAQLTAVHPPLQPLTLETLDARMMRLEQQTDVLRNENGFFRWRLAELEAPLQAPAAAAAGVTLAGAETSDQEEDRKPPLTHQRSASSRAVETLVMEESMASSLREKQQAHQQQQQQADAIDLLHHQRAAEEQQRQRQWQEWQQQQRAQWEAQWAAEREKDDVERERQRCAVAAELDSLREENAALTTRVAELEKGNGLTTRILRDMYYALDG